MILNWLLVHRELGCGASDRRTRLRVLLSGATQADGGLLAMGDPFGVAGAESPVLGFRREWDWYFINIFSKLGGFPAAGVCSTQF